MSLLNKIVLYPTIVYGVALEYFGLREWYTRVDNHCILGALPMKRNYKEIVKKENVKAVLTLNEDHELAYSISRSEWLNMDVDYMQIAVPDYHGVASLEQLKMGVDFILKHKNMNQCVYVHCKAGRYRSALMVACYLINIKEMKPDEAADYLKSIRPHVTLKSKRQYNAMDIYYNYLFTLTKS